MTEIQNCKISGENNKLVSLTSSVDVTHYNKHLGKMFHGGNLDTHGLCQRGSDSSLVMYTGIKLLSPSRKFVVLSLPHKRVWFELISATLFQSHKHGEKHKAQHQAPHRAPQPTALWCKHLNLARHWRWLKIQVSWLPTLHRGVDVTMNLGIRSM